MPSCLVCSSELPPRKPGPGRLQRLCSELCRSRLHAARRRLPRLRAEVAELEALVAAGAITEHKESAP